MGKRKSEILTVEEQYRKKIKLSFELEKNRKELIQKIARVFEKKRESKQFEHDIKIKKYT
jgi:hypothetical protein